MVVSSLTFLGCHPVVSGVDPEPLGYGPAQHTLLASGYDTDPVPRATPTPWTPPERTDASASHEFAMFGMPEPVAHTLDVISICAHLGSGDFITDSETDPAFDARCRSHYRIAQVFRTIGDWKSLVACLMVTADDAGVADCKHATPASVVGIAEHPRESVVCMHLFALSIVEELGPEPMLEPARLAEFGPLVSDCVDSLVAEERAEREPSEYLTMLECVEAAQSTAVAEVCAQ